MSATPVPTQAAPISASNTYASELASREPEEQLQRAYDTPELLPKHKIFISHSGRQKDFAEQLCEDLERHGYYPFFDKRSDSLPKGKKFPPLIFEAARECLVAVVLISKDFFTKTKWPMLELAAFVEAHKTREDLCILPVLLGLTPEDVRNTAKWSESWTKWGEQDGRLTHSVIVEWEAAVQSLKSWNMISKGSYDGEVNLRKGIVKAIMKLISPDIRLDVLHVQGRERLCKEVCPIFDRCLPRTSGICKNAAILGVHGIGGAGKSTLCMIITEYLRSEFKGRVCMVELGTGATTVQHYRRVLHKLCSDDPVFLNIHIQTEGEGLNRLKERVCRDRVFLAIDNVSDEPAIINTARSFLRLEFYPSSQILVTSRSNEVLCKLLGIPEGNCMQCLSPTKEEALEILLEQVNLTSKVLNAQQTRALHRALMLSYFNGYHPLALQVLAAQLGTDQSKWGETKLDLQWSTDCEHPLFSKIETNYLRLPDLHTKDVFMDVALFTPECFCGLDDRICWLADTISLDVDKVKQKLEILKVKALLEITNTEDETFRIHDLNKKLAQRNAQADTGYPKFIYQEKGVAAPNALLDKWQSQKIERATFVKADFEMLGLETCTSLKVLNTRRCEKLRALCIKRLTYLVSLEVVECALESLDLSGLSNLRWLHISSCNDLMKLDAIEVKELRHVNVSKCSKLTDLNFKNCSTVKSVSFLYNEKLSHVNLGDVHSLECLTLWFCGSLTDVEMSGDAKLTILKKRGCPRLLAMAMQQGGDIMCGDVQYLSLEKWGRLSSKFVSGLEISASLRVLDIWHSCMSRLPDLRKCLCLQELRLSDVDVLLESNDHDLRKDSDVDVLCEEYEKIMCLSTKDLVPPPSLEDVRIESCKNMVVKEIFWKLQGLRNLRIVSLQDVRVAWDWELDTASNLEREDIKMGEKEFDHKNWFRSICAMQMELSMDWQADFSYEVQNEVGVSGYLKKIKQCLQVFGIEGRNPSLSELKRSIKAEQIGQQKSGAKYLTLQHYCFGHMFRSSMKEIVEISGSVCWIVERIIIQTFTNCDLLCEFLLQELRKEGWLKGDLETRFVELCQKAHVQEICGQLHFLTAMHLKDIVKDCGVWTSWEYMIIKEVSMRASMSPASSRSETVFFENHAVATTRFGKILERLKLLCVCRGWQVYGFEKQERMQFAWEWLWASRMCLSLEELKDCLVRQSPVTSELESYRDDMQELLRCNDEMFNAEMEKLVSDDTSASNSFGSLIRRWKVRQWLLEVESCLSKHLSESGQRLQEEKPHKELPVKELVCISQRRMEPTLVSAFLFLIKEARSLSGIMGRHSWLFNEYDEFDSIRSTVEESLGRTESYLKEVQEFLEKLQETKSGLKCPRSFLDFVIQLDMQQWQSKAILENSISIGGKWSRWKHAIELYTTTSVKDWHGGGAFVWPHVRCSFDMAERLINALAGKIELFNLKERISLTTQVEHISLALRDELNFLLHAWTYLRNEDVYYSAELKRLWKQAKLPNLCKRLCIFMAFYDQHYLVGSLQGTLRELLKDLQNVILEEPCFCVADDKHLHINVGKLSELIDVKAGGCWVKILGHCLCAQRQRRRWQDFNSMQLVHLSFIQCSGLRTLRIYNCSLLQVSTLLDKIHSTSHKKCEVADSKGAFTYAAVQLSQSATRVEASTSACYKGYPAPWYTPKAAHLLPCDTPEEATSSSSSWKEIFLSNASCYPLEATSSSSLWKESSHYETLFYTLAEACSDLLMELSGSSRKVKPACCMCLTPEKLRARVYVNFL